MADARIFTDPTLRPRRLQAGIITRIRLQNFMCHSNLEIEFGDSVNFITGQNGSGKSAILTALCVAFGSRARGTQRAYTMKDFIKTGCSSALVQVEIKNQGEDAFKPDLYGDIIVVERRIAESTSSTILKSSQGRRVATKREDLHEIIEHFNIDVENVENPCVIMSQDKSREFLHSGNAKDKFKATLLQQVDNLLKGIAKQLNDAEAFVNCLEESLRPTLKELEELQEQIKNVELVEEIRQQVQLLQKKLAWSVVYDAEKELAAKRESIEKRKGKITVLQGLIDDKLQKMEELINQCAKKKVQISNMMEKTSEVRRIKEDFQQKLSMAMKEQLELDGEQDRTSRQIQNMVRQINLVEQQIHDLHEQYIKSTQAEENEIEEKVRKLQIELQEANDNIQRLKAEEGEMTQHIVMIETEIGKLANKVDDVERWHRDISYRIRELEMNQRNKVTAFGGGQVISLLQAIERRRHKFSSPPIGPIGAHVKLEYGDMWSIAIETAVGKLLNAFIVSNHKDALTLRACGKEANYNHVQIIIHNFSRPRIDIPRHMRPQTDHPTVLSVLRSDNPTVLNVLIDMSGAERQVLVKDYDVGKAVAFDQRISNLKEVYTSDGYKMSLIKQTTLQHLENDQMDLLCRFSRGSVQTIFPPIKNFRAGRLCGSFDNEIKSLQRDASKAKENAQRGRGIKRAKEEELRNLRDMLGSRKRRRIDMERRLRPKEFELEDMKKLLSSGTNVAPESTADELRQEISKLQDGKREKEALLGKLQERASEARNKAENLKMSFKNLCESAKSDIDALAEAERELMMIEKDLHDAETEKKHYEVQMHNKALPFLQKEEAEYQELEHSCKEKRRKVSTMFPESEIEDVEGIKESDPNKLDAQLTRLKQRLDREKQRFSESIDDLRMLYEKKERKISRKRQTYKAFQGKLDACHKASHLRWEKFQRSATLLKRQLTWQFNGHLKKKGISGQIVVSYEEQTLSVEVTMPQDASNKSVQDTKGLSGGERSFSTLCFALALHEMTESPFRAMDEFDVFMDAVSRKISLDAIVDFALAQGSQWIFITPHDISMVKNDERIKKQQMAAPRG